MRSSSNDALHVDPRDEPAVGVLQPRHVKKARPSRKIVTGRRDCVTGYFPSAKALGPALVAWEGTLARDFIVVVENDPEVEAYQEEPPGFPWFDGHRWRRYTPDLRLDLLSGARIAVEVKPSHEVDKVQFRKRLPRLRYYGSAAGYDDVWLITQAEIDLTRLANAALVNSERGFVADEAGLHAVRVALDRLGGEATVAALRVRSGLGARAYRAVVALVARGEADLCDPTRPFDDHAMVRIPR